MNAPGRRALPELLLGLIAVAVGVVITGIVVANAIRDVKRARDTIRVTGSAREPISADLAHWSIAVSETARQSREAVRLLAADEKLVTNYLRTHGLPENAVATPPVAIVQTTLLVAPRQRVPAVRLIQRFRISSRDVDKVENVAASTGELLNQGVPISSSDISYLATNLTQARYRALTKAIADAKRRAERIVQGIGGHLGSVKNADLGVYQVVPRDSTAISDYGINDTSSREKDVYAVVSVTFRVH